MTASSAAAQLSGLVLVVALMTHPSMVLAQPPVDDNSITKGGAGHEPVPHATGTQGEIAEAAEEPGTAGEIIVTANRRAESVDKSSIPVTVLTGRAIDEAGITQAIDLPRKVPELSVTLGGASLQTYMRGVGTFLTDASAESPIAYSINGVSISRPTGVGAIFFDLERVEVLRGPQGTLYGRNASGGAINIFARRPERNFSWEGFAEAGNYELVRLSGAIGGPLGSTAALRAAAQVTNRNGYLSDGYKDQKNAAARLGVLWQPSDQVDLLITGEYVHHGGQGDVPVKRSLLTPLPEDPWQGPSIGMIQQPPTAGLPGGARISDDGFQDIDVTALSAELESRLGGVTMTFIPAWRRVEFRALNYVPGFPFDREESSNQWSAELRLSGEGRRFNWIAGAFFFDENQTQEYELRNPPLQQLRVNTPLFTRSYALFGDTTFSLLPDLRLIAGVRYSKDRKRQEGFTQSILPVSGFIDNSGSRAFDDISWRTGIELDVRPDGLLFATAATGYKAGGFFPSILAPDNSYRPERITALTLGSRNRLLGRRLQLDVEAFYWMYRDKQERFIGVTPAGAGLLTTNAARARQFGARLDMSFMPATNHRLYATAEYLNARYRKFAYTTYNPSIGPFLNSYQPEATGCLLGSPIPFTTNDSNPALRGDSIQEIDCSGQPLVRAPKWVGAVGYEASLKLNNGWRLVGTIDGTFASRQYLSVDFIGSAQDDGYFLTNARVTLQFADGLSLSGWGRNLFNEPVYAGGFRYVFSRSVAAGGDPTLFYANIGEPRTFGLTLLRRY